jgi:hypothetical protein
VETGTGIPVQGVDRRTAEEETDTRIPVQRVDRRTAEEQPGRNIPVQGVDNRHRAVEEYSTSWPTGTNALLAASERNNRT